MLFCWPLDKTDIAFENGMDDFKRITKVPAIHTYKDGVSHGGTYSQPNGGDFARVSGDAELAVEGRERTVQDVPGRELRPVPGSRLARSDEGD